MNKILKYLPGLIGAVFAYIMLRFISWTGLTYEFISFLISYLFVTLLMDKAMRSYGK